MTGFEYAFADSLLQCGMEQEALSVVRAIRDRYDGKKRNPFSEIECGASYSRAMASYSLLLTYSGFQFDMTRGMMGFKPLHAGRYFWSLDGAWGVVEYGAQAMRLRVLYGEVALKRFAHPFAALSAVRVNGADAPFGSEDGCALISVALRAGDMLELRAQ